MQSVFDESNRLFHEVGSAGTCLVEQGYQVVGKVSSGKAFQATAEKQLMDLSGEIFGNMALFNLALVSQGEAKIILPNFLEELISVFSSALLQLNSSFSCRFTYGCKSVFCNARQQYSVMISHFGAVPDVQVVCLTITKELRPVCLNLQ